MMERSLISLVTIYSERDETFCKLRSQMREEPNIFQNPLPSPLGSCTRGYSMQPPEGFFFSFSRSMLRCPDKEAKKALRTATTTFSPPQDHSNDGQVSFEKNRGALLDKISFAKQAPVQERKPPDHNQAVQDRIDILGGGWELLHCLARTLGGPHTLSKQVTKQRQKWGTDMHHMSVYEQLDCLCPLSHILNMNDKSQLQ